MTKPPEYVQATQEELDELLALARPVFPAPQYELLSQVLATFVFVMQALRNVKTSLTRFRKLLFGASTESKHKLHHPALAPPMQMSDALACNFVSEFATIIGNHARQGELT